MILHQRYCLYISSDIKAVLISEMIPQYYSTTACGVVSPEISGNQNSSQVKFKYEMLVI